MKRRPTDDDPRRQRLAEALRENLRRRKTQGRARTAEDAAPEGGAETPETPWTASRSPAERP
jgi:hypothetical protein